MNIQQANSIPMSAILEKLGIDPTKTSGNDVWYNSPFRTEKTESFKINTAKNVWYDHGEGKGGDVVAFVVRYLESNNEASTVHDALRWLKNMMGTSFYSVPVKDKNHTNEPKLALQRLHEIKHPGLIAYLDSRKIPLSLAKRHLKEAVLFHVEKGTKFNALAMRNEDDGYELKNKFFKGSFAAKAPSFIRGSEPLSAEIHIFEGMDDFLAALCHEPNNVFRGDVIVLHSISNLSKAMPYLKDYPPYKTIFTWLDNDDAGDRATEVIMTVAQESNLTVKRMNHIYRPDKDVNEWHVNKLSV